MRRGYSLLERGQVTAFTSTAAARVLVTGNAMRLLRWSPRKINLS
jgi:hypothetical protein